MKVTVRFFAGFKELLGCDSIEVTEAFEPRTIEGLRLHLQSVDSRFQKLWAEGGRIRAALDHEMADDGTPVGEVAEVAFFPPVTGG